jgi:hypothetical protein
MLLRELQDPVALMSDSGKGEALKVLLTNLCTVYLRQCRMPERNSNDACGTSGSSTVPKRKRVIDPVAHFHFGNGALLNSVHWRCAD